MSLRIALQALAALLLSSPANGHMYMDKPVPFNVVALRREKAPINRIDQYPCNPTRETSFVATTQNNMAVGEIQPLSILGEANHGGGSCKLLPFPDFPSTNRHVDIDLGQISIATDKIPSGSSKFKVIQSFEGGCPLPGNSFNFTLPSSVPNGNVVLAWSWLAKVTGEFYMNCAPVTVTGGASDASQLDQLPDMFVARIPESLCTIPTAPFNTKFPDPGEALVVNNSSEVGPLAAPSGPGCGKAFSVGSVAATGSAASMAAVSQPTAALPISNPGGIYAPSASSVAVPVSAYTVTTLVTSSVSPSTIAVTTSPQSIGTALGAAFPSASASIATCPADGAVVCNGTDQFGVCDNGKVVWQAVAAGTKCQGGKVVKRHFRPVYKGRLSRPRAAIRL